jgi:hypothetical protein
MRSFDRNGEPRPNERGGTTIRVADYQTQPSTRTSWNEMQIRREEIRLPQDDRNRR